MRKIYGVLGVIVALTVSASCAQAQARTSVGAGFDQYGSSHFHLAIEDTYGADVGMVPGYIHEEELPVIYLLAREAGVSPTVVMMMREQGWSWLDITYHLGVDPYVYVSHLPRGNAYGYWGWPRGSDYGYLTDRHIVDYVNLAFWATYHRRPVTQIIVIRQSIPTWVYYVNYHSPRVVYRTAPRRHDPPPLRRGDRAQPTPPRQARPRDATARRAIPPAPRTAARPATATRPAQPATRPSRPAARPSQPAVRPSRPAARPSQPVTRTSRPAARPAQPVTRTSRPAARPARPVTRSSRPAARPAKPVTGASRPAAKSSRPAARTSRPAAKTSRTGTNAARTSRAASRRSGGV